MLLNRDHFVTAGWQPSASRLNFASESMQAIAGAYAPQSTVKLLATAISAALIVTPALASDIEPTKIRATTIGGSAAVLGAIIVDGTAVVARRRCNDASSECRKRGRDQRHSDHVHNQDPLTAKS
jgi:hypothetical protein